MSDHGFHHTSIALPPHLSYYRAMANTSSAKKASRGAQRKRVFNERRKRAMKTGVKDFKKLVSTGGKEASAKLPSVFQAIDKARKRGVINRGAANRMKSNLSKLIATK
jgi:small subunit ribosomal protein S20